MIEKFKLMVFRLVADNLNYRRAADELYMIQPAVTAQLRSLEESVEIVKDFVSIDAAPPKSLIAFGAATEAEDRTSHKHEQSYRKPYRTFIQAVCHK